MNSATVACCCFLQYVALSAGRPSEPRASPRHGDPPPGDILNRKLSDILLPLLGSLEVSNFSTNHKSNRYLEGKKFAHKNKNTKTPYIILASEVSPARNLKEELHYFKDSESNESNDSEYNTKETSVAALSQDYRLKEHGEHLLQLRKEMPEIPPHDIVSESREFTYLTPNFFEISNSVEHDVKADEDKKNMTEILEKMYYKNVTDSQDVDDDTTEKVESNDESNQLGNSSEVSKVLKENEESTTNPLEEREGEEREMDIGDYIDPFEDTQEDLNHIHTEVEGESLATEDEEAHELMHENDSNYIQFDDELAEALVGDILDKVPSLYELVSNGTDVHDVLDEIIRERERAATDIDRGLYRNYKTYKLSFQFNK